MPSLFDTGSINLGSSCWVPFIVTHEFGHMLGFHHEHQRSDRDKYVTANLANVEPFTKGQYDVYKPTEIQMLNSYDVKSLMHYGSYHNSINGKPVITIKGTNTTFPESKVLSAGDKRAAALLYGSCGK